MKRSVERAAALLASVAAVVAVLGLGFTAGRASADPADPVAEMRSLHEDMHASRHGMGMGMGSHGEMDEMHAQMSAWLSEEDRALHDRMHEACGHDTSERSNT